MPKKIILHVGMQKTGTSSLQHAFYQCRKKLLDKGIFYVDDVYAEDEPAHHNLYYFLSGNYSRVSEFFIDNFISSIKKHDCTLISSECFSYSSLEMLKELQGLFSEFEICIVIYIRKWNSYHYSLWKQWVKNNYYKNFELFLDECHSNLFDECTNYKALFDKFSKIFGLNKLYIIPYDNVKDKLFDSFRHIIDVITNQKVTIDYDKRINVSAGSDLCNIEFMRAINYSFYNRFKMYPCFPSTYEVYHKNYDILFNEIYSQFKSNYYNVFLEKFFLSNSTSVLKNITQEILKEYSCRFFYLNSKTIFDDTDDELCTFLNYDVDLYSLNLTRSQVDLINKILSGGHYE